MGSRKNSSRKNLTHSGPLVPAELSATLNGLLGEELPLLEKALEQDPPTTIRLNANKPFNVDAPSVPWCSTGRYLDLRPSFTFDPLLHAGAYYVQEASSMFLEKAMRASGLQEHDVLALDLCAAPGGKSTHLRSLLTTGSLLVANETDDHRRSALTENLWKWGAKNVVFSGSDPRDLTALPDTFDLILVDAPCSGEGMFRKDEFARSQWSPGLVHRCSMVQQNIISQAWNSLAPSGCLIYSTCTWEPRENEAQIRTLIDEGAECVDIPIEEGWGIERSTLYGTIGYRFYPHRTQGEGFFLSMIRKPGERVLREDLNGQDDHEEVRKWLIDPEVHFLTEQENILYAVDTKWHNVLLDLQRALRKFLPGIPVAQRKGNAWQPHPALALNFLLDLSTFQVLDVDRDTAIRYLRGEALSAKSATDVGLVSFHGLPLGWVQGAGNRWNNRWPATWRIRSQQPKAPPVSWASLPRSDHEPGSSA